MVSSTTNLKLPYPDGTDPVMQGDDAIANLAKALDGGMIPYRVAAGSKTFSIATAAAQSTAQAAAFDAGRFTFPPLVFFAMGNNPAGSLKAVPRLTTTVATTGFSFNVFSSDGTNITFTGLTVNWWAVQMLPAAAGGGGA